MSARLASIPIVQQDPGPGEAECQGDGLKFSWVQVDELKLRRNLDVAGGEPVKVRVSGAPWPSSRPRSSSSSTCLGMTMLS